MKRAALFAVLLFFLYVLLINSAVRIIGKSEPFWLSPGQLENKRRALTAFVFHLPKVFRTVPPIERLVKKTAQKHGVDPKLALAVAKTESRLLRYRISAAGAMGIMQLMPDTADHLKVDDPFDPKQNIDGGVRYLKYLLGRYKGDVRRVAAAYNAGPGNVPEHGPLKLFGETRHYVKKVLRKM